MQQARIRDRCAAQVEESHRCPRLQPLQSLIGDGRSRQIEAPQIGDASKLLQVGIPDGGVGEHHHRVDVYAAVPAGEPRIIRLNDHSTAELFELAERQQLDVIRQVDPRHQQQQHNKQRHVDCHTRTTGRFDFG